MNRPYLPILLFAALAGAGSAHAESFAVKTGGWEMTMSTTVRNASPPPDAAKLPPEQLAAIEKSLRERSGRTDTTTYKTCVTREDLESGQGLTPDDDEDGKCTVKLITQSRSKLEQERTCTSPPSTTRARFEAKDAEHLVGVIERTGPGSVRMELSGHWASASCKGFDD